MVESCAKFHCDLRKSPHESPAIPGAKRGLSVIKGFAHGTLVARRPSGGGPDSGCCYENHQAHTLPNRFVSGNRPGFAVRFGSGARS